MVRAGRSTHKVLVHGSRRPERLYLGDYLRRRMGEAYRPCRSGAQGEGCHHGPLLEYLGGMELPGDVPYLLCGSAEMVVAVRDLLMEKGVSFGKIVAEIFF